MQHIVEFAFSSFQKWGHIDPNRSGIGLKLTKTVGVLNRLNYEYPLAILKTLYNTLFLPHLNYGILLWGSETESIHKVQKRALRIISDNKFNAHTEPICRAERLLKVKDIYRLGIYKFYYKLINNHLPHYFQEFTPTFSVGVNHYSLRNTIRQIPRIKHEFPRHSIATYRDCCDIPNCYICSDT